MYNIKQYENFMRNILEIPKEPYQSLLAQCNFKVNLIINIIRSKSIEKNIIIDYNDTIASVLTYCIVRTIAPFQSEHCSIYLCGKVKKTKNILKQHNIEYKTISYQKIVKRKQQNIDYIVSDFNPILYVFENSKKYKKLIAHFYPIKDFSFEIIDYLLRNFYNLYNYQLTKTGIYNVWSQSLSYQHNDFNLLNSYTFPSTIAPLNRIILINVKNIENIEKIITNINLQGHQLIFYYAQDATIFNNEKVQQYLANIYDSMMLPQRYNINISKNELKKLAHYPIMFIGDWTDNEKIEYMEVFNNNEYINC